MCMCAVVCVVLFSGGAPAGREEAAERIEVDAVTVGRVRDKCLHAVESAVRALVHLAGHTP